MREAERLFASQLQEARDETQDLRRQLQELLRMKTLLEQELQDIKERNHNEVERLPRDETQDLRRQLQELRRLAEIGKAASAPGMFEGMACVVS